MNNEPNPVLTQILAETKELMVNKQYREVVKRFDAVNLSHTTDVLVIFRSVATLAQQNGDNETAYYVFNRILTELSKPSKLGETHEDVVRLKYNIAAVSPHIRETHKLLKSSLDIAIEHNYTDLVTEINVTLGDFMKRIPPLYRRMYTRLDNKK